MSRRSGQLGEVQRHGKFWTVRFRLDVPEQEKRIYRRVKICPVSGPGLLTKPEIQRRAREIVDSYGANSKERFNQVEGLSLGVTFREQSKCWLEHVQTRNRKPVRANTAEGWKYCLDKWILPAIGDMPLSQVGNPTLKGLVATMKKAGLSAKTIDDYIQPAKMVVGSLLDEEGEPVYPRKWNNEFIDMPVVENQRQPVFTGEEISNLLNNCDGFHRMLYALKAGSGLRIGEALAVRVELVSRDRRTIEIQNSTDRGQVGPTKTRAGVRFVDLHSSLAAMLDRFIGGRMSGFLFSTTSGRPMTRQNIMNRHFNPLLKKLDLERKGYHAFRRFRVTHLRENRVPEDLIRFWVGHKERTMTDKYSKLKADGRFRRGVAEQVGLGFELPASAVVENDGLGAYVAPNAPKIDMSELPVVA